MEPPTKKARSSVWVKSAQHYDPEEVEFMEDYSVSKFKDAVKTKFGFMCAPADIRLLHGENVLPSTDAINDWAVDKNFGASSNPLTAEIHAPAEAQVELTDELIQMKVENREWCLPTHERVEELLNRQQQLEHVRDYILTVQSNKKQGKSTFPLLGTSGMKGIGKTQLLLNGLNKANQMKNVKGVYFTFNGQGDLNDIFQKSISQNQKPKDAFGQALMQACNITGEIALKCNFNRCLSIIRKLVSAGDDDSLVVFVDELSLLDAYTATKVVVPVLQALMGEADVQNGKLAFIFSHLQEEMLRRGATEGSGRQVDCIALTALPIDCWKTDARFEKWKQSANKFAGVHQLLLSCAGHPRSLFDGLQRVAQKHSHLLSGEAPTAVALDRAREQIICVCKFDEFGYQHADVVRHWFNPLGQMDVDELDRHGLLVRVETGSEAKNFFHPLVLSWWASKHSQSSSLAFHLRKAYEFDAELGHGSEKRMEGLMYHYEAALRIALGEGEIGLQQFYKTEFIGISMHALKSKLPPAHEKVLMVEDFANIDDVIQRLKDGYIIVSSAQTEIGIEYLTPWTEQASGNLIVACVQCKFVQARVSWSNIKAKMHSAIQPLQKKKIRCFPVVYATSDQDNIRSDNYKDGVCFNESAIFDFTAKMGILRLHTEKLGHSLSQKVPVLNRARSNVE